MNSANLITAYRTGRRDYAAAWAHNDPHLTVDGLRARQRAEVERIRATVRTAIPEVPAMPDRGAVLDALQPKTADDYARMGREREKVRALVYAGQDPEQGFEREPGMRLQDVIATADRARLAAIADDLEVMPHLLDHPDRDRLLAAYGSAVWERLVQIDPAALAIAERERDSLEPAAWSAVLTDLAETGEATMESLTLLQRANPDAYRPLIDGDQVHLDTPGSQGGIPRMLEDVERVTA